MTGRWHVDTMGFQLDCPLGGWVIAASCLAPVLAVSISMMAPDCLVKSPMCFLDVVSIHQTDMELMERGVYGLGGFLQVSKELRALLARRIPLEGVKGCMSPLGKPHPKENGQLSQNRSCVTFRSLVEHSLPYKALVRLLVRHEQALPPPLSSSFRIQVHILQVFELAAFRRANPRGRITLQPISAEIGVLLLYLSFLTGTVCYQFALHFSQLQMLHQLVHFVGLIPSYAAIHVMRRQSFLSCLAIALSCFSSHTDALNY